jgi:DNA-binding PadR family transcriptional regulator
MLPYTLLGLLASRSRHGYDLKNAIEQAFGGQREINFGQIYTTLSRLERDSLVTASEAEDGRGKKTYSITPQGQNKLETWLDLIVEKNETYKDEFLVKLIVRHMAGYGDTLAAITRQRQAYLQQLRDLTALSTQKGDDPYVSLLIEGAILHLQADLHWLEMCDERLEHLERPI